MRERGKLGFRARSVIAATRRMLDDGAITVDGNGFPDRAIASRCDGAPRQVDGALVGRLRSLWEFYDFIGTTERIGSDPIGVLWVLGITDDCVAGPRDHGLTHGAWKANMPSLDRTMK
jgi:hypothetical protein